jgi:hypothetical protein
MDILFSVLETAKNFAEMLVQGVWAFLISGATKNFAEIAKNFAETLAILVGGGWAFYRFVIRRESKPALDIALTYRIIPEPEDRFLAYFDVTLTNKSTHRVLARKRKPQLPAFSDRSENLQHSCSLLLRRVGAGAPLGTQVRWFDPEAKSPLPTDIAANLLEEYEYDIEGKEDFWLEPSEISHLCVGVILQPGVYLAMVTFVGQPSDDSEFWRRLFIVQIPERDTFPSKDSTHIAL